MCRKRAIKKRQIHVPVSLYVFVHNVTLSTVWASVNLAFTPAEVFSYFRPFEVGKEGRVSLRHEVTL